jgi:hypothetical protein
MAIGKTNGEEARAAGGRPAPAPGKEEKCKARL